MSPPPLKRRPTTSGRRRRIPTRTLEATRQDAGDAADGDGGRSLLFSFVLVGCVWFVVVITAATSTTTTSTSSLQQDRQRPRGWGLLPMTVEAWQATTGWQSHRHRTHQSLQSASSGIDRRMSVRQGIGKVPTTTSRRSTGSIVRPTRPSEGRTSVALGLVPQQLGTFEPLDLETKEDRELLQRGVILENWLVGRQQQQHQPRHLEASPSTTTTSTRTVPFDAAWKRQQLYWQQHADRLAKELPQGGAGPSSSSSSFYRGPSDDDGVHDTSRGFDRVIFLQHDPVYTLGTGSDPAYILTNNQSDDDSDTSNPRIPVVRMDRGGEVTYHGPGQLVAYPVIDLRNYKQDIHWYMRALEECVIMALQSMGIHDAYRDDGATGVWIHNHKVAAIGVRCRKWVTMHGVAINVEPHSLTGFDGIVPCGLEGRKVGCVSQFAGRHVSVEEFAEHFRTAMEDVFQITFVDAPELNSSRAQQS